MIGNNQRIQIMNVLRIASIPASSGAGNVHADNNLLAAKD